MIDIFLKKLADAYEASCEQVAIKAKREKALATEAALLDADYHRLEALCNKCLRNIQLRLAELCPDMWTGIDNQYLEISVRNGAVDFPCVSFVTLTLSSAQDNFEVCVSRHNPDSVAFCLRGPKDEYLRLGSMSSLKELLENPSLIETRVGELCSLIAQEMVRF